MKKKTLFAVGSLAVTIITAFIAYDKGYDKGYKNGETIKELDEEFNYYDEDMED